MRRSPGPIGDDVRRELVALRPGRPGIGDDRRGVARRRRRSDRPQRLAGAPRARRDAARHDELERLGLRAHAARDDDPRAAARAPRRRGAAAACASRRAAAGAGAGACGGRARPCRRPSPAERAEGAGSPRDRGSDELREAGRAGRPRRASRAGSNRPPYLIHFTARRNRRICRAFFMAEDQHTQPRTSPFSRVSSRSGCGRACTSARPAPAGSTTSSTRSSTTPSTRRSRAATTASRSRSTRTTRSPSATTGAGIPVDVMPEQGCPALEVVLTKLHAGGKFGGDGYKVSGGLHGVGVSVVNALSEWLVAEVHRDGKVYRQEFARGVPKADMEVIGARRRRPGTTITFLPDAEIFEELEFSAETLVQRLRETAFLTRGLAIVLVDERAGGDDRYEFHYEGGIRDFVAHVNEAKDPVHKHIVYFEGESERGRPSRSRCSGTTSYVESVFSFANNINTHEGGSHLSGFRAALTGTLNKYARDKGLLKEKEDNLEGEDVREGLAAVISVKLARAAVRGADEDEARQPVGPRASSSRPSTRSSPSSSRRTRPTRSQIIQKAIAARERAPGGAQGARADPAQGRARAARRCRASSPTARSATRRRPSSSSSRATRPAARRRWRATTAPSRRSCRCAARSSTPRRTASTRSSRTPRSRR